MVILFGIGGGEILLILIVIVMLFGADKIPEFARMVSKGAREFQKATDDIKREIHEGSSGMLDEVHVIRKNLTDSITKDIAEPVQKTVTEATKTFEEFHDQCESDYYYDNQNSYCSEYQSELQANTDEKPETKDE